MPPDPVIPAATATAATDGELLRRFADHGDQEAFALVAQRHARLVLGVCQRVLGNGSDADDAAQATFLALARRAGRLRGERSVGAWLHHVSRGVARNARAAAATRAHHEREAALLPPTPIDDTAALRECLDRELAALPERYRAPLILFHLEERSLAETAQALGRAPGTVGVQLERGRELLRRRLERAGAATRGAAVASLIALILPTTAHAESVAATSAASLSHAGPGVITLADGAIRMLQLATIKTVMAASLSIGALAAGGLAVQATAADSAPAAAAPARDDGSVETLRARIAELEKRNRELEHIAGVVRASNGTLHARLAQLDDRYSEMVSYADLNRSGLIGLQHEQGHSLLYAHNGRITDAAATLLKLQEQQRSQLDTAVTEALASMAKALGPIPFEADVATGAVTLRLPAVTELGSQVRLDLLTRLDALAGPDRAELYLAIVGSRFHDDPFLGFGAQPQEIVITPVAGRLRVHHQLGTNTWRWDTTYDALPWKYSLVRPAYEAALRGPAAPTPPAPGF